MALLDPDRKVLVVRVVYDGPAFAGKTTNLKSLATLLGSDIHIGPEEDGRTLQFDWVDFVGGLFDRMPIRCQVVSVPGQRVLAKRRRVLLETADSVVFVADSRPERQAENIRSFQELRELAEGIDPPPELIVQANKRDVADAIDLEDLRSSLDHPAEWILTEAVAEDGRGVRETFVRAVGRAVARARDLKSDLALPRVLPEVDNPEQLAAFLAASEQDIPSELVPVGLGVPDRRSPVDAPTTTPAKRPQGGSPPLPSISTVRDGHIWPVDDGRALLEQALLVAERPERRKGGDWLARGQGWLLHSPLSGLFFRPGEAFLAFGSWARWHQLVRRGLSQPRCVVLVAEPAGAWRIWQVVARQESLLDRLRALFRLPDDDRLGEQVFQIALERLAAEEQLVAQGWFTRLDLASISLDDENQPLFAGLAPYPVRPISKGSNLDPVRWIHDELGPLVSRELEESPHRIQSVLASFHEAAARSGRSDIATELRNALLWN